MKYVKEIMWIIAFTFLGELLNTLLPLPVPAGVYGMILLLIALVTGIVKLPEVEGAGNFLLDTMTMMFIPAAVGIMSAIDILLPVLLHRRVDGARHDRHGPDRHRDSSAQ